MPDQKIKVRITETDKTLDVVVFSKKERSIEVVLGEGVHSTKCELTPTANGSAFAGSAMGREIVYERSVEDVKQDLATENHDYRDSRRR